MEHLLGPRITGVDVQSGPRELPGLGRTAQVELDHGQASQQARVIGSVEKRIGEHLAGALQLLVCDEVVPDREVPLHRAGNRGGPTHRGESRLAESRLGGEQGQSQEVTKVHDEGGPINGAREEHGTCDQERGALVVEYTSGRGACLQGFRIDWI